MINKNAKGGCWNEMLFYICNIFYTIHCNISHIIKGLNKNALYKPTESQIKKNVRRMVVTILYYGQNAEIMKSYIKRHPIFLYYTTIFLTLNLTGGHALKSQYVYLNITSQRSFYHGRGRITGKERDNMIWVFSRLN